jgi:hypothetical protein
MIFFPESFQGSDDAGPTADMHERFCRHGIGFQYRFFPVLREMGSFVKNLTGGSV